MPARRRSRPAPRPSARPDLVVLCVLLVAVPVVVDPQATDPFSTVKFAVLVAGVAALLAVAVWRPGPPSARRVDLLSGLVIAVAAWTAVATAAGVNPRYSLLGAYGSYDGLVTAALFAGLFFAVARVVDARWLRTVATAVHLGAGGPVVLYGLVQLHDRVTSWGGTWDPFDWPSALNPGWVWSTMGNPNHLAAFCAVLLPLGLALVAVHEATWVRAAVGAVTAGATVLLVYAATRGAWLGAAAGLVTLAVLVARDLAAHRRAAGRLAASVVAAVLVAGAVAGTQYDVVGQVRSMFDPGATSAVERADLWRAAWGMAADRPLVGVGPDAYRLLFNRHQPERHARLFGTNVVANGPHNVLFAHLAAGGIPGLGLFLALLAAGAARARRGLRRLGPGQPRLLLAAVVAALVAFVVQAMFNTQEVDLNFWFWALLGMLAGATRPDPPPPRGRPAPARRAAAGVAVAAALVAAWLGSRPYRADRVAIDAARQAGVAVAYAREGLFSRALVEAEAASRLYDDAGDVNPWQPDYPAGHAVFLLELARWEQRAADARVRAGAAERIATGRLLYRRAVRLEPENPGVLAGYAEFLVRATQLGAGAPDYTDEARAVVRRAQRANPHDRALAALARSLERGQ